MYQSCSDPYHALGEIKMDEVRYSTTHSRPYALIHIYAYKNSLDQKYKRKQPLTDFGSLSIRKAHNTAGIALLRQPTAHYSEA